MFQDMLVKIRKIIPMFTPIAEGMSATNPSITIGKKPSIGTDWNMSKRGIVIDSALLFLAARIPTARLNPMLKTRAINILVQE